MPSPITASRLVGAPADRVYAILADYHVGHPAILPPQYFGRLTVEKGGTGAGTIVLVEVKAFGTIRTMRGYVTEPEPGRVLVESYPDTGDVTTFIVEPAGASSRVTFATELGPKPGIMGWIERALAPVLMPIAYRAELARLDAYARGQALR